MNHNIKMRRAKAAYTGFAGTRTIAAVSDYITQDMMDSMTGAQIGAVMSAVYAAYNAGRASTGASVEDDCVWVAGKLIPLAAIDAINITKRTEPSLRPGHTDQVTTYTMAYKERC